MPFSVKASLRIYSDGSFSLPLSNYCFVLMFIVDAEDLVTFAVCPRGAWIGLPVSNIHILQVDHKPTQPILVRKKKVLMSSYKKLSNLFSYDIMRRDSLKLGICSCSHYE
jgi:hypothetical protein